MDKKTLRYTNQSAWLDLGLAVSGIVLFIVTPILSGQYSLMIISVMLLPIAIIFSLECGVFMMHEDTIKVPVPFLLRYRYTETIHINEISRVEFCPRGQSGIEFLFLLFLKNDTVVGLHQNNIGKGNKDKFTDMLVEKGISVSTVLLPEQEIKKKIVDLGKKFMRAPEKSRGAPSVHTT